MASEHHVGFFWSRGDAAFTPGTYPQNYVLQFPGGLDVDGSPAPEFGGSEAGVDPEQALVAALSSCHALTFLALAAKRRFTVETYQDDATCSIGKREDGKSWVDVVWLRPRVVFAQPIEDDVLRQLHEQAHRYCFIANSVKSDVRIEPQI
ncbi:OsmC family protein [Roseiterribacter gracilis]|uniref:Redox protein OsmC n=1 Tax=Roseiterribacter gracilis TaxID=2812848 RepID=A0A8S8XAZ5_9PROT|nr:redox protein OsmC [Rhodospirillales bacterium TMPK1]